MATAKRKPAARTKTTRKPAAAKRSPKPPAKTAKRAPRSTKARTRQGKGRIASSWRKNVADRWVIHWRVFERLPWAEIVQRDGRTKKAVERVVGDYLENVESGDAVRPLERDPVELIEGMLNELTVMRDVMVALVQTSDQESTVVAAGREWRRLVKEVRELLQGVGKLPKELGTMRHLIEVREMADLLDKLLDRLEAGTISPQELRAQIAEWAGVQALPPADVSGDGEPIADADVVPS